MSREQVSPEGGAGSAGHGGRRGAGCCGTTLRIAGWLLLALALLLGAFTAAFFLIPREPCVSFEQASPSNITVAGSVFSLHLELQLSIQNPSYVGLGLKDLDVDMYDAVTSGFLGHVSLPFPNEFPARTTATATLDASVDQRSAANFLPCAAQLALTRPCRVRFLGTTTPIYSGAALGNISFNASTALFAS